LKVTMSANAAAQNRSSRRVSTPPSSAIARCRFADQALPDRTRPGELRQVGLPGPPPTGSARPRRALLGPRPSTKAHVGGHLVDRPPVRRSGPWPGTIVRAASKATQETPTRPAPRSASPSAGTACRRLKIRSPLNSTLRSGDPHHRVVGGCAPGLFGWMTSQRRSSTQWVTRSAKVRNGGARSMCPQSTSVQKWRGERGCRRPK